MAVGLAAALLASSGVPAGVVVESAQAPAGATSPLLAGDELLAFRLEGVEPARGAVF